jgi:asparagine synthase (glutamine-hydrolysing)
MCGIAGIMAFTEKGCQQIPKIQQSIRTLLTRGPDDEGIFVHGQAAIGQRRLAIIDTRKEANQPMWDKSGRYAMVYNGEIFNYRQLRSQFFSAEEINQFRTHSDTELLLELYLKLGPACLPLLEGFFAFAVYDTRQQHFFLARDRFGQKPLHLFQDDDVFIFASELKALFAFDIPKKINAEALRLYLQFSYIPQPLCILQQVRKLAPGFYMTVENGRVEEKQWYQLPERADYRLAPSYEDARNELARLMEEAVVKRLISDVPLGAFLSGGIDSSIIVALAARHQKHLNTFSVGFKGKQFFDETKYAELIAKKYKTNHATFSLGVEDYLSHIFDVLDYLDEPFADSSALPQYILCKETRKHATVAVSGDGGDEVFAGYNKHYAEWQVRKKSLLNSLVNAGSPLWKVLPKGRHSRMTNFFRQLNRFSDAMHLSAPERYWHWASTFSEKELLQLLHPDFKNKIDESAIQNLKTNILKGINEDDFNSVLRTDMDLVLAGDMLVKTDLMSMANSVEVRCPFLDHQVVEFAFRLPASYKINGKHRKRIVKDTFRHLLPREIYLRGKKGFEIPMLDWFRNELYTFIFDELLNEKTIRDQALFDYGYIANMKKQLRLSSADNIVDQLWVLIVFQYWYRKYFL